MFLRELQFIPMVHKIADIAGPLKFEDPRPATNNFPLPTVPFFVLKGWEEGEGVGRAPQRPHLWINNEWPTPGTSNDDSILGRKIVGRQTKAAPLVKQERLGQESKDVEVVGRWKANL
jgi:hypothetical protein